MNEELLHLDEKCKEFSERMRIEAATVCTNYAIRPTPENRQAFIKLLERWRKLREFYS